MRKLWITARAFPYGEANSHNETIHPGAFASGVRLPVKMLRTHGRKKKEPVGAWTELRDTAEGMFFYGYVEDPEAIADVRSGRLREVSIYYTSPGLPRMARELGGLLDYLDGKAKRLELQHQDVYSAKLVEISLVDAGSFRGTEIHTVKEEK